MTALDCATHLLAIFQILDHILVSFTRRIYTCFCALYWKRERIHDHNRIAHDFALHETHNLVWDTRTRVDYLSNMDHDAITGNTVVRTILINATAEILHDLK